MNKPTLELDRLVAVKSFFNRVIFMSIIKKLFSPSNYGRIRNNRILLRLVTSLTLPAVAVILAISIFFSWLYSKNSMNDIDSISFLTLSNLSTNFSNMLESTRQTSQEIYNNQNVIPLFYPDPTHEDKIKAGTYIGNIINSNPQIYSIYLYVNGSIVLTIGGSTLFEENNEEITALINDSENLKPRGRQLVTNNGALDLITTVYYQEGGFSSRSYVIINLKPDALYNQVNERLLHPDQSLIIADRRGNILAHSKKELFAGSLNALPYFKSVISSAADSGSIDTTLNGKRSIINYLLVNNRSYAILFTSDYNSFFGEILSVRNTILLFCLAIFLLLAVVSIYITRRIYNPINTVFSNIRNLIGNNSSNEESSSGEIMHISRAIGRVVERLNNLEKDSESNFNSLRANFLHTVFSAQNNLSPKEFEEGLAKYRIIKNSPAKCQTIVFRVDGSKQFSGGNSKESIVFQLSSVESIVCETFRASFECSAYTMDLEHIVLLLFYGDEAEIPEKKVLAEMLRQCQDITCRLFNLTLAVGIGRPASPFSMEEFTSSYREAFDLTNYRLVYGRGLILHTGSVEISEDNSEKTAALADSIINCVKSGSLEQYKSNLDLLFNVARYFSYEKILTVFFHLAELIARIPTELHLNNSGIVNESVEQMYVKIKGFEDYGELKEWFVDLFLKTHTLISGLKSRKASDLFDIAVRYIHNSYHDSSLSAACISERLGITPQYFSRVFKQFTGMNFPDYINNIRLEKAKELLLSNPLPSMAEVCEKTGYNSASYFTTSFTKKYGVPPSKFLLALRDTSDCKA